MLKLILVTAPWCVPCSKFKGPLAKLASELNIPVETIDAEDEPAKVADLNISSLPTTILVVDGKERSRLDGAHPVKSVRAWLKGGNDANPA